MRSNCHSLKRAKLKVCAEPDHRPALVQQVIFQAIFRQHRQDNGEHRDQGTRIKESTSEVDPAGMTFLDWWNDGSLAWVWGGEGCIPIVRLDLEVEHRLGDGHTDDSKQNRLIRDQMR